MEKDERKKFCPLFPSHAPYIPTFCYNCNNTHYDELLLNNDCSVVIFVCSTMSNHSSDNYHNAQTQKSIQNMLHQPKATTIHLNNYNRQAHNNTPEE